MVRPPQPWRDSSCTQEAHSLIEINADVFVCLYLLNWNDKRPLTSLSAEDFFFSLKLRLNELISQAVNQWGRGAASGVMGFCLCIRRDGK